jgi:hypothetical protein
LHKRIYRKKGTPTSRRPKRWTSRGGVDRERGGRDHWRIGNSAVYRNAYLRWNDPQKNFVVGNVPGGPMRRLISTVLVGAVGWLVASLAVAQEAGTLRLETAAWVPKRDASYGWWGAARAGDGPKRMVQTIKDGDTLSLPPGSYDVWWVQD